MPIRTRLTLSSDIWWVINDDSFPSQVMDMADLHWIKITGVLHNYYKLLEFPRFLMCFL